MLIKLPSQNEWIFWWSFSSKIKKVMTSYKGQSSHFQGFRFHTCFDGLISWGLVRKATFCNQIWFETESEKNSISLFPISRFIYGSILFLTSVNSSWNLIFSLLRFRPIRKSFNIFLRNKEVSDPIGKEENIWAELLAKSKADQKFAASVNNGVSIVICTRDCPTLIENVLIGVLDKTSFKDLQVIIVDNGTVDLAALAVIEKRKKDPRVLVVRDPSPFNYSKLNNQGSTLAKYDHILFLNNDIEIISADWLTILNSALSDPTVGAVGCKLLYPNRTIQHAGVVLGLGGVAGHPFAGVDSHDPGPENFLICDRWTSAVTGACLLTRKKDFENVGGFDQRELTIAFNDVDYCLKLAARGLKNLWKSNVVLIHHESVSRGNDKNFSKRMRFLSECDSMLKKWPCLYEDPYFDRRLSLDDEKCHLR